MAGKVRDVVGRVPVVGQVVVGLAHAVEIEGAEVDMGAAREAGQEPGQVHLQVGVEHRAAPAVGVEAAFHRRRIRVAGEGAGDRIDHGPFLVAVHVGLAETAAEGHREGDGRDAPVVEEVGPVALAEGHEAEERGAGLDVPADAGGDAAGEVELVVARRRPDFEQVAVAQARQAEVVFDLVRAAEDVDPDDRVPKGNFTKWYGVVDSCIFKGVHYEMTIKTDNGYEFMVQDYHEFVPGTEVGMLVKPEDIQ